MTNYTKIRTDFERRTTDGTIAAVDRFYACDSPLLRPLNGYWVLSELALPAEDIDYLSSQVTADWARFEKLRLEPFTRFRPAMSAFDAGADDVSPLSAFDQPLTDLRAQFPGPVSGGGASVFDALEAWALSVTKNVVQLKSDTKQELDRAQFKTRVVHIALPVVAMAASYLPWALGGGMPTLLAGGGLAVLGVAAAAFHHLTNKDWTRNVKNLEGKFGGLTVQNSLKIGRIYAEQSTLSVQAAKDAYHRAGQAFHETWQAQTPREYPEQQGRWAQVALLKEAEAKAQAVMMDLYSQKVVMAYHGVSAYTAYQQNFTPNYRSHMWSRLWGGIGQALFYIAAPVVIAFAFVFGPLPMEANLWGLGLTIMGLLVGGCLGWRSLRQLRQRHDKPYAEADFRTAIAGAKPSETPDTSKARLEHLRLEAIMLMREDQKRH